MVKRRRYCAIAPVCTVRTKRQPEAHLRCIRDLLVPAVQGGAPPQNASAAVYCVDLRAFHV